MPWYDGRMCSRYGAGREPKELAERFGAAAAPGLTRRYNIAPSQRAPVVIAAPARRMTMLAWGLAPAWAGAQAKPQINARAESLADKPYFRDAFKWRRALVPADGWYEWPKRGEKTPRWFSLKGGELFAFAGLWEPGGFAVVTVEANPVVAKIHDRMPAILPRDAEAEWLSGRTPPERLKELLRPYPSERLDVRIVSPRVGSTTADEPSLREPAAQAQGELF